MAATVERLTFPLGEGGQRKAEAEESSLSYGLQSQRKRQKVKNVPTLKVTKVKKVMKVVKFMYQFDLLMETNGVNEVDQKSYLLESVHPDMVHCLLVKGVEVSSPGEMMALVKETVLGQFWQKRLLDKWQSMAMLDSESVFQFQQRVHMITFALGWRPERINEHWVILFAKIRLKLPVILREMLKGEQILTNFGMSWSEFWLRLEEIESLMAYQDRLLLYKNFGEGKLPSSDSKGPKGKERSGTSRKGAGESGTAAGDSASSSSSSGKKRGAKFCMCCGDCSHGTEDCKHPKASKISLVDGKLLRICFKCFETGHSKKFCPGEGKTKGASGGGSGGSSLKGATGAVRFCGAVPISNLCWAKERGVQEFLLDKEFGRGEVLQDFQKGKPGGVFPVIDRAEDLAKGKEKEESSPPVASEPSEVDISKMKVQKESDFRSDSSQESDYPFVVGDLEVMGRLDSGSDYLMVDPEVWVEMEGEQVQVPIAYVGISGKIQVLYEAKLVIFRIEDGETNYLAYPMPTARLGIKALVPWELARELGAELRNIPKFFPGRALRSDDKKWIRGKEVFNEKKLEELQREDPANDLGCDVREQEAASKY